MSTGVRIGFFWDRDGHLQKTQVDVEHMHKVAAAHSQVQLVQEVEQIYTAAGLAQIKRHRDEYNLDGVLLASGHLTPVAPTWAARLAQAGLNLEATELVDWQEMVFEADQDREWTNQKAEVAVRRAIARLVHKTILQLQEVIVSQTVLVLGQGWSALHAAAELSSWGLKVLLVTSHSELGDKRDARGYTRETAKALDQLLSAVLQHPGIEIRFASQIVEFDGVAGQYRALVADATGGQQEYQVGGVILALEPELTVDWAAWGLRPAERVRSLADLEAQLHFENNSAPLPTLTAVDAAPVLFLLGFTHNSSPVSQRRAFRAALELVENHGRRVLVVLDHFKVAEEGLEALSQQARQAGVVFVKVTGSQPVIAMTDEALTVRFFDEVMNQELVVQPQLIVLEEALRPPPEAPELEKTLGILADSQGFFQGDHVYNLPIYTNRTGVLAVGPARGPSSLTESFQEVREAALYLYRLLGAGHIPAALDRIRLDRKKCAICLTCYRLCPHRAISVVHRRPVFSDLACKVCGLCAVECPMAAIQLYRYHDQQFQAELRSLASFATPVSAAYHPLIVALGCRNSAREAARLAAYRKLPVPLGLELIEVPCAGKVDLDYVMTAFKAGADGVMVLACHPGSCKSFQGSPRAWERVAWWQECLGEAGLEPERLIYRGLAPGMSQEFTRLAQEFEAKLLEIKESPVRQALRFQKTA
ncbi:MAG: hydrogenase iron-sulfur subunit [Desulfobacca sp.]|nr:hydrogenase iron-sulfur subunit [Desulfobacca sp.]